MVKTTQIDNNRLLIEGDCINEIIEYCIPRIRKQSQDFYKREIREDLEKRKYSLIDIHAGMNIGYDIKIIT